MAESALSNTDPKDDLVQRIHEATADLERQLKDAFEESCPIHEASVWADLIGAALGAVNWRELAAHLVEAAAEELDEDEREAAQ